MWGLGRDGVGEPVSTVSIPHSDVQLLVYPMIGHYFVTGYFNTYFSHLASRMLSFTYMSRTETLPHCTFWCFDLWHFDRRKGFFGRGQGGVWIKVFEKMITGSLLLFSRWFFIISYFTAHLFFLFIGTDQGPGIGYILSFEDSYIHGEHHIFSQISISKWQVTSSWCWKLLQSICCL